MRKLIGTIGYLTGAAAAVAQDANVRPKMPGEVPVLPAGGTEPQIPQKASDAWIATFRTRVQSCWNVANLEEPVAVVVRFEMDEAAHVVVESIASVKDLAPDDAAGQQAYEVARRAVIRCGKGGYDLPRDLYARWRVVELTFDPEGVAMR